MAERRMFTKTIIDSDEFLDMPLSTQALYFHLSMRADDEGFVNNYKKIMRMTGASQDEIKVLVGKRFILIFESGIIVIKHWKLHNCIRKDRLKETVCKEEKKQLVEKDNVYSIEKDKNCNKVTPALQAVTNSYTEKEIDKEIEKEENILSDSAAKKKEQTASINNFFETVWELYPRKRGKGSVSDTQKEKLYKLGDEIKRAVERYSMECISEKKEIQYYKNGSTFFNSAYVDYLDENFTVENSETEKQRNARLFRESEKRAYEEAGF